MQTVTFETAKLAKKKGFKQEHITFNAYALEDLFQKEKDSYKRGELFCLILEGESFIGPYEHQPYALAPFQCQLQKWLRDKHGIAVHIYTDVTLNWVYSIQSLHPQASYTGNTFASVEVFNTYEEALEKGLYEALKVI